MNQTPLGGLGVWQSNKETDGVFPIPDKYQVKSDRLDAQTVEIQLHCKAKCHMIYRINSDFLPGTSIWHKRLRMFRQMLWMSEGQVHNTGVLCKKARKLGIVAARRWTAAECVHGMAVCRAWKRKLCKYAQSMRFEHLQHCLIKAEANEDEERAKAIQQ